MEQEEIKVKVMSIINNKLNINECSIDPHASMKDLGIDSLDEFDIILEIEDNFKINFPNQFLVDISSRSIDEIIECMVKLLNKQDKN